MRYRVRHTTTYAYSNAVSVCHNELHLCPRQCHHQTCSFHELLVYPEAPVVSRSLDYFGNPVTYFTLQEPHQALTMTANSIVEVAPVEVPTASAVWEDVRDGLRGDRSAEGLEAVQFVFDSPYVAASPELLAYAAPSFAPSAAAARSSPGPDRTHPRRVHLRPRRHRGQHAAQRRHAPPPRRLSGLRALADRLSARPRPGGALRQRLPRHASLCNPTRSSAPMPRTLGCPSTAPGTAGSTSIPPTTCGRPTGTSPSPSAAITATSARSRGSFSAAATTPWRWRWTSRPCRSFPWRSARGIVGRL